jgi:MFS family permease
MLMASMDQTVVATALPELERDLHTTVTWAAWTLAVAGLGRVLAMPIAGVLSDRYGGRRVFLASVAMFATASLGCALAGSIWVLLPFRAVQALGAGAFIPSATSIVAATFGRDRDRAIGFFTSIFPIGALVGPVFGGFCIAYWSWHAIFLVNVPISALLLAFGLRYLVLPADPLRRDRRLDTAGLVLFGAAVLSGMLCVSLLSGSDLRGFVLAGLGLCGCVTATVGYRQHAKDRPDAFIALDLLKGRGFVAVGMLNLIFGAASLGLSALVPLYARERYAIGPVESGLLLTARAIGTISVAGLTAMALRRTGYRWPMYIGFCLTAVGLIAMATPSPIARPATWLAAAAALTGIGFGLTTPASSNAAMQLAPDRLAAVAGIRGMFRQIGSISAVSVAATAIAVSAHPAFTHAGIFAVFAVILLLALPLVARVPDHRGSW